MKLKCDRSPLCLLHVFEIGYRASSIVEGQVPIIALTWHNITDLLYR